MRICSLRYCTHWVVVVVTFLVPDMERKLLTSTPMLIVAMLLPQSALLAETLNN